MSHKELKSFYEGSNSKMEPYATKFEPFELTKFQNSSSGKYFKAIFRSSYNPGFSIGPDWTDV